LSSENDTLVWKFEPNGVFSVKSMYAIINFRGIVPVHVHSIWKLKLPPKIHFFLCLVVHNKNLTRDNLVKRQSVDDLTCTFCIELKTCNHLFFDCVVAKAAWTKIKFCAGSVVSVVDINSLAKFRDNKRDNSALNMIHAGLLWVLWLTKNDMYIKRNNWFGMQVIWRRLACTLAQWGILLIGAEKTKLDQGVKHLEGLVRAPPPLLWPDPD
jgi:hypothetical protein